MRIFFIVLTILANVLPFCIAAGVNAGVLVGHGHPVAGVHADSQPSELSVSITCPYDVYLTDEPVTLTAGTGAADTSAKLSYEGGGEAEQRITDFQMSKSYVYTWTAPSKPGSYTIILEGNATVMVWTECTDVKCSRTGGCTFYTYPCQKAQNLSGSARREIKVLSRLVIISGYVNDEKQVPIRGASVKLAGAGLSAVTDFAGYYKINAYKIGSNYARESNGKPSVGEKISFDAVACDPVERQFTVYAGSDISNLNASLQRVFCPAGIRLDDFTYDSLAGWKPGGDFLTWQNVLGLTTDKGVSVSRIQYAGTGFIPLWLTEVSFSTFSLSGKELALIDDPEPGRYFLEVEGEVMVPYTVQAAATLKGRQLENVSLESTILMGGKEQISLVIDKNRFSLEHGTGFPFHYIIVGIAALLVLTSLALVLVLKKSQSLARAFGSVPAFFRSFVRPGRTSVKMPSSAASQSGDSPPAASGGGTATVSPETKRSAETKAIPPGVSG